MEINKADAKAERTRKNIYKDLKESLSDKYNKGDITNEILKIHGLDSKRFDFISNAENFLINKINDVSIDGNANKNETNIETIVQETIDPVRKLMGYDMLYRQMKTMYGKDVAKTCIKDIYDYSLVMADSTKIPLNYCWAFNANPLISEGRSFGQLHSAPCKHLHSYISALCETVHQMANNIAGACAIPTLFFDSAEVLMNDGIFMEDLDDPKIIKYIENEYQQFVHSINHLSRCGAQSPFSNVSVFDRVKIKNILTDIIYRYEKHNKSEDYIVEYIIKIQDIFMDFFDKGDPMKNGVMYRFPVLTVNISKEGDLLVDKDFIDKFCKRDVIKYNIFVSEGTKVCSCCRLILDEDRESLANSVSSFGSSSVSLGSHRVVTINFARLALEAKSLDDFFILMEERIHRTTQILKAHKQLLYELTKAGLQPFISNGYISLSRTFSTYGIGGIYECAKILTEKYQLNGDILKQVLVNFNEITKKYAKQYDLMTNCEFAPLETQAVKMADIDRMIFGKEQQPYVMYANQFVPLWEDSNIFERMEVDGKYNLLLSGGGIVHIQVAEKVSEQQARRLIDYAVKCGCQHFALNGVYTECVNGHVHVGDSDKCVECGEPIKEKYTRIVGFMVPVSSFSKTRREWEFPRRKFNSLENV